MAANTQTRAYRLRLVRIRELLLVLSKGCRVVIILCAGCARSNLAVGWLPEALALWLEVEVIVGERRGQLIVLVDGVLAVLGLARLLPEHLIVLTLIQIAVRPRLLLIHHILTKSTTILAVAAGGLHLVQSLVRQLLGTVLEKPRR